MVGAVVAAEGEAVGILEGVFDGAWVGSLVDGDAVGTMLGIAPGTTVGEKLEGGAVYTIGCSVGEALGTGNAAA